MFGPARKRLLIALVLLGGSFAVWAIMRPNDPITTAKEKCEEALERFTGHEIGVMEVRHAVVDGDINNATVRMQLARGGKSFQGECVFDSGSMRSVMVDGKLLAGSR